MRTDDKRKLTTILNALKSTGPNAIYGLAVVALQENSGALTQISRQGRRSLSQYENVTQQLFTMRQLFTTVATGAPGFEPQNEGVETKLTEEPTESETVKTEPVETKLIGLGNAPLPISLPAQPARPAETEARQRFDRISYADSVKLVHYFAPLQRGKCNASDTLSKESHEIHFSIH